MSKDSKVTPVGFALYPKVQTPDTKFKKEGQYKTGLRFSRENPEHAQFIDQLIKDVDDAWNEERDRVKFMSKGKKVLPSKPQWLPYKETEEGFEVNFKANATYVSKKTGETMQRRLKVMDRFGQVINEDLSLGSGTLMRLKYTIAAHGETKETSVSLYIDLVQIAKPVKFEGDTFEALDGDYGEEDGDSSLGAVGGEETPAEDGKENF